MYKVIDKNIYLNRGEKLSISVVNNSEPFKANDILKFSICKQGDYSTVVFQKEFTVDEEASEVVLSFTAAETKIGEPIKSGEKTYWYEIELNDDQTLLGWDQNGPKLFVLWPEATTEGGE